MLYIVLIVISLLLIVGGYFAHIVIHPHVTPKAKTRLILEQSNEVDLDWLDQLPKEAVKISSFDGTQLYGEYYPNGNSKKTLILSHGITWALEGDYKYMPLFYKRGFNILVYDHRNHGLSEGKKTMLGYIEKFDLVAMVDFVMNRTGAETIIGTHGESMGGATVLQHAAIDHRIKFVIADCAFSDAYQQLKYRLKVEYHLPAFPLLTIANGLAKILVGTSFKAIAPIKVLDQIQAKVLFIHGKADTYILPEMSIAMHEALPGSDLLLVDQARHSGSLLTDPMGYEAKVVDFLTKHGIL